jgi:hypothetical protein
MNQFKDQRLTVGSGRSIRIINHPNRWLNGKVGTLIGKDHLGFYNYRVWLRQEHLAVIVSQSNLVPAEVQAASYAEALTIRWLIFWHNAAIKLQGWLTK